MVYPGVPKESEKVTEKYLISQIQKLGGKSYKWSAMNTKGLPDRIVVMPHNSIFFVELKSEGKKPTALQLHMHEELRLLGCRVYTADTKARINEILELEAQP
jgi:hypothetical protein